MLRYFRAEIISGVSWGCMQLGRDAVRDNLWPHKRFPNG